AAAVFVASAAVAGWWLWARREPEVPAPAKAVAPMAQQPNMPARPSPESAPQAAQPAPPPPDPVPPKAVEAPPATARQAAPLPAGSYEIAVAACRRAQRAEEVADAIAQHGLPVSTRTDPAGAWHRIVVGPLASPDEAESAQRALARQGFSGTKISASTPAHR